MAALIQGRRVWRVMVWMALEYSLDCIIIHSIFKAWGQAKSRDCKALESFNALN